MTTNVRGWLLVRLLLVGFWAFSGITNNFPTLPASQLIMPLIFAVVVGALGVRFRVFREYKKQNRTEPWLLPSWSVNPLQTQQPFQFFHLGGISFLVFGVTAAIRHIILVGDLHTLPVVLFAAAIGLGILGGIKFTTSTHKEQFISSENNRT